MSVSYDLLVGRIKNRFSGAELFDVERRLRRHIVGERRLVSGKIGGLGKLFSKHDRIFLKFVFTVSIITYLKWILVLNHLPIIKYGANYTLDA